MLDKWRGRWPEWRIAQAFVPEAQRATAEAWFALLQEWTDAAWAGADPTPGFAKLAWWQEELRGWAKGARRHPLGRDLHRRPLPWDALAAALPALQAAREPLAADMRDAAALAALRPLAEAAAHGEAVLFGGDAGAVPGDAFPWLAAHALRPRADAHAAARAWARALPAPARAGTRPRRVYDALAQARLRCFGTMGVPLPLSPLPTLWRSWRAARG
ncbi:MAG: phytoene/squalene synthase family protein [Xanthomonadales bacterium]|nr:phytoene/squalene synthase family protein [Xanthomonadales bacterium]